MPQGPRDIIERLTAALGLTTQAQLASSLEIKPQSIISAINRGEIPEAWLYRVAYQTGRSVEWLRTGKESAWHGAPLAEAPAPAYGDRKPSELLQRVVLAWDSMKADEREMLLRCAEILNGADRDLRGHLVAQLQFIEEMAQARRGKRTKSRRSTRR